MYVWLTIYTSTETPKNAKSLPDREDFWSPNHKILIWKKLLRGVSSDPAGIRTQDPYIKSVLLYQLSYRVIEIMDFKL